MQWRSIILAALAFAPAAAHATTAINYNVVVRGNFTSSGSDTEGRIAAGGNISVGGYSIGLKDQASAGSYAAVAGGTFTGGYGTAYGSILANSFAGNFTTNNGSEVTASASATSPIAIASEMSRLTALSKDLYANAGSYGTIGAVSNYYGQLTVQGTSSGVNIFDISASALSSATGINITVPTGSLVVFNVDGTSDSITNSGAGALSNYYSAANATNILFNFYQATALSVQSDYGSILAPLADVTANNGAINGQLFANSYTGSTQINYDPLATQAGTVNLLSRSVTAVPEPATWGMMILGFGAIGFASRRQRQRALPVL